jgi:hypothetical protein
MIYFLNNFSETVMRIGLCYFSIFNHFLVILAKPFCFYENLVFAYFLIIFVNRIEYSAVLTYIRSCGWKKDNELFFVLLTFL